MDVILNSILVAIVPCFNAEAYLKSTLDSCIHTNGIPAIVVDDGSTDDSVNIALSYGQEVTVVQQTNSGPSVARNRGILEANSEFVLFLDSDDLLREDYYQRFREALKCNPGGDIFICGMEVINEQGTIVDAHPAASLEPTPLISVLCGEPIPTNGIIVRRALFAKSGLFHPKMKYCEDIHLWMRLCLASKQWIRMDHQLAVYRLRNGSLSKNALAMWQGLKFCYTDIQQDNQCQNRIIRNAIRVGLRQGSAYVFSNLAPQLGKMRGTGNYRKISAILIKNPVFLNHFWRAYILPKIVRHPNQEGS